jgi:hypothetical protein
MPVASQSVQYPSPMMMQTSSVVKPPPAPPRSAPSLQVSGRAATGSEVQIVPPGGGASKEAAQRQEARLAQLYDIVTALQEVSFEKDLRLAQLEQRVALLEQRLLQLQASSSEVPAAVSSTLSDSEVVLRLSGPPRVD